MSNNPEIDTMTNHDPDGGIKKEPTVSQQDKTKLRDPFTGQWTTAEKLKSARDWHDVALYEIQLIGKYHQELEAQKEAIKLANEHAELLERENSNLRLFNRTWVLLYWIVWAILFTHYVMRWW